MQARTIHDQAFRIFPVEGVGSGVIIDEKCHVLTNNQTSDFVAIHLKVMAIGVVLSAGLIPGIVAAPHPVIAFRCYWC